MFFFDKKLFKFLIVGVLNTLVGAGIMFLLYNIVHCSYWFSSAMNYIIGGTLSFFLNKYFTFENTVKSSKQVIYFILNLVICYLIAYIGAKHLIYFIFKTFSEKTKDNIAMMTGMLLYTIINYITQRFFIFKKADTTNE